MSKFNLWNSISLTHTGRIKLLDAGRELFGTVIQHGVNDKTVTVRVSSRYFNHKYKKPQFSSKNKQVHDEHNYCVAGDKVIIANCHKLSNTKAYYIKTIVQPVPRTMAQKVQTKHPQGAEVNKSDAQKTGKGEQIKKMMDSVSKKAKSSDRIV